MEMTSPLPMQNKGKMKKLQNLRITQIMRDP